MSRHRLLRVMASLAAAALLTGGATDTREDRLLAAHNKERALAGSPPLRWNSQLTRDAKNWAATLARRGALQHAMLKGQGENLWQGTRGHYTPEDMVNDWISEKPLYKPGRFPDIVKRGSWTEVGHYTQLIWSTTTDVGCAIASNTDDDFLVCRYSPAGNIAGQSPTQKRPVKTTP